MTKEKKKEGKIRAKSILKYLDKAYSNLHKSEDDVSQEDYIWFVRRYRSLAVSLLKCL